MPMQALKAQMSSNRVSNINDRMMGSVEINLEHKEKFL